MQAGNGITMRGLFFLVILVVAVRSFSSHIDEDHVHDHDYPYNMGENASPETAARETAISSIELIASADANERRIKYLQSQLDELETEVDKISDAGFEMWPRQSLAYFLIGEFGQSFCSAGFTICLKMLIQLGSAAHRNYG